MENYITDAEVRSALRSFKSGNVSNTNYGVSLCDLFSDDGVDFNASMEMVFDNEVFLSMLRDGWKAFDGREYLDIDMYTGKDGDGKDTVTNILGVVATHEDESDPESPEVFKFTSCVLGNDNTITIEAQYIYDGNFSFSIMNPIEILANFGVCVSCFVRDGNMKITPLKINDLRSLITIKNSD